MYRLLTALGILASLLAVQVAAQSIYLDEKVWLQTENQNLRVSLDDGTIFATGAELVAALGSGTCPADAGQICWVADSDDCLAGLGSGTLCGFDGTAWAPLGSGGGGGWTDTGSTTFALLGDSNYPANAGRICYVSDASPSCADGTGTGALCWYDGAAWVPPQPLGLIPLTVGSGLGSGDCPAVSGQSCWVTDRAPGCVGSGDGALCAYDGTAWRGAAGIPRTAFAGLGSGDCGLFAGATCWVTDVATCAGATGATNGVLCTFIAGNWTEVSSYQGLPIAIAGLGSTPCGATPGRLCWINDALDEIDCSTGGGSISHACLFNGSTWERAAHVHGQTAGFASVRPDCDVTPQTDCFETIQEAVDFVEATFPTSERFIVVTPNAAGSYVGDVILTATDGKTGFVGLGLGPTIQGDTDGTSRGAVTNSCNRRSEFINFTIEAGNDTFDNALLIQSCVTTSEMIFNAVSFISTKQGGDKAGQVLLALLADNSIVIFDEVDLIGNCLSSCVGTETLISWVGAAGFSRLDWSGGSIAYADIFGNSLPLTFIKIRGPARSITIDSVKIVLGADQTFWDMPDDEPTRFEIFQSFVRAPQLGSVGRFVTAAPYGGAAGPSTLTIGDIDGVNQFQVDSVYGNLLVNSATGCANPFTLAVDPREQTGQDDFVALLSGNLTTNALPPITDLYLTDYTTASVVQGFYTVIDVIPANAGTWTSGIVFDVFPFTVPAYTPAVQCTIDQNSLPLGGSGLGACVDVTSVVMPPGSRVIYTVRSDVVNPTPAAYLSSPFCIKQIPR